MQLERDKKLTLPHYKFKEKKMNIGFINFLNLKLKLHIIYREGLEIV